MVSFPLSALCRHFQGLLTSPRTKFKLFIYLFNLAVLVFELRASRLLGRCSTTWTTPPDFFFGLIISQDRVSWTICLGWLRTVILLISAPWVATITGRSHQCPAKFKLFLRPLKSYAIGPCWQLPSPSLIPLYHPDYLLYVRFHTKIPSWLGELEVMESAGSCCSFVLCGFSIKLNGVF
jgi:hypothetical protein